MTFIVLLEVIVVVTFLAALAVVEVCRAHGSTEARRWFRRFGIVAWAMLLPFTGIIVLRMYDLAG